MKPTYTGTAAEVQNRLFTKLHRALRTSNFMEELHKCRVVHFASSIGSANEKRFFSNTADRLSCLNSFHLFRDAVSTLSAVERTALNDSGLQDLFSVRTMNQMIFDGYSSDVNPFKLEAYCLRLQAIYDYKPVSTEGLAAELVLVEESTTDDIGNCVRRCRETALRSIFACMAAMGLGFLLLASGKPLTLEPLRHWSSSESTYYKTVLVILVLLLTICVFQVVTRIARPIRSQCLTDTGDAKSVLANVFTLRASGRRLFAGCVGPVLLGLGTGVSASAGFGAFGVTVMLDGLHQTYGVPFWLSQLVLTLICYLTAWVWARITLGPGTIPALFLIGPAISFSAALTPQNLQFIGNVIAFMVGTLVFSLGIALTAAAALGPDGKTALSLAAEKASNWPIPHSAFLFNLSAILIGITLAGNFGIATILNLLAVPVLLHYFIPPMRRYLSDETI